MAPSAVMLVGTLFIFYIFKNSKAAKRRLTIGFGFTLMFFWNALVISVVFIGVGYTFFWVVTLLMIFSFAATLGPIIHLYLIEILTPHSLM